MSQQFYFAQKAFIRSGDQILLVRKSSDDPSHPGKWEVPGGRMAFGEDVDAHIVREVQEEVGIQVEPGAPFYIWQWRLERKDDAGRPVDMQIVAVARLCLPTSTETSDAGRVADDYLGETRWVPIAQLLEYELIPNMIPVARAFLLLDNR